MQSDLLYRMAFASVPGMTRTLAAELKERFGSEQEFMTIRESVLRSRIPTRSKIFSDESRAKLVNKCRDELHFIERNRVHTLYYTDELFPPTLNECDDAPLMIYGLGEPATLSAPKLIGIVGTRHATPYGVEFTKKLIQDLADMTDGAVIVSGLAYGIDVAAHRAAMKCGLPTVAVMAHGLHTIYPADHRSVAVDIVSKGGMLVTEYRTDDYMHKGNFVARNRIVAGMCHCLVVVESAHHGGALITARLARDYNRDVFALPGRVTDTYSEGCNRLIASNCAAMVRDASELCEAMGWSVNRSDKAEPVLPMPMNSDEEKIVDFLRANEDSNLSRISAATGISLGKLSAMMVDMEFRNLILALPGAVYRTL